MSTPLMPMLRQGAFTAVIVFSLILLPLNAHVTNTTQRLFGGYFSFSAVGIATALLSLVSLPLMLVMDKNRKDVFTSKIIIELSWMGFLWILWLSSAATATQIGTFSLIGGCGRRSVFSTTCREIQAIQAFSWLAWLAVFGYVVTLLMFTIRLASRGYNRVWLQSVRDTEFNAPPVSNYQGTGVTQVAYPPQQGGPVVQQQQWTGQQQPV